jgi:hypothetical protein
MKCPHCLENFFAQWQQYDLGENELLQWRIDQTKCPACERFVVKLRTISSYATSPPEMEYLVYPKAPSRAPLPQSVPDEFAGDYREACLVLADSPKASAALSRRCLQHLLREKAGVTSSDLSKEIDEAMPDLPAHLADAIDSVRNLGNFAAHPIKSESTGEVVDVEPGEAEWLLDTLEGLFDHYFIQRAILDAKRAALNSKLSDVGKPDMKSAEADGEAPPVVGEA